MLLNRIFLIILIIATGTLASFYGGNITYSLFYMSLAIPVISFFYTYYVYVRLKMYQEIDKRKIVKGEVTEYIFQLSNEDKLPYQNIKVDFYQDKSRILGSEEIIEYSLLPGETKYLETSICCNYRGEYYVGAKTVTITDFLYLFSITYPVLTKMKVLVLPRVITLSNINMISTNSDSKRDINYMQDAEKEADIEVRKYISGDNKKLIHWKVSAKKQELLTRKYITLPKTCVVLYMDLIRVNEDELTSVIVKDKIIEGTLAIANYCMRKHIPCKIHYDQNGLQTIVIQNQNDFDLFYHQCVELNFNTQNQITKIFEIVETQGLSYNRLFENKLSQHIFITHYITDDMYKIVLQIESLGNECGIIYINEQMTPATNYLVKIIREAGASVTIINHTEELEEVL